MASVLIVRMEAGRADETDLICEWQLANITGQPSLDALLRHADKFDQADIRDIMDAALHLPEDQFAILEAAMERQAAAKKKARFA